MERGTVSNADIAAELLTYTVINFIKNRIKPNIQYWVEYVEANFDRIAEAKKSEASSSTAAKKPATVVKPIIHKDTLRACIRNLNSIVRTDSDDDIKDALLNILSTTLEETSNYTSRYGFQIYKLFSVFKNHTFDTKNKKICFVDAQGFKVNDIFPEEFHIEDNNIHVPPHIKESCLDSKDFEKEAKKLFNFSHLQYIQSIYFGPQGIKESTLKVNPIHDALVKILPRPDTTTRFG